MTIKIATIIGARPQFIKAATVSRLLLANDIFQEVLIHTGQHYDKEMSAVFFDELELPKPKYNLNIGSGSHGQQTGAMLAALEEVLLHEKPDWVLIYGDTNSTLAGALAAVKLGISIAHVEAGLRSFNRKMPEEINRIVADEFSELLFTPTEIAVKNLLKEGISEQRIRQVGDVMYDAALFYGKKAEQLSTVLQRCRVQAKNYVLATIHRAENTDDPLRLRTIIDGLSLIAKELPVIFPVHPRTRKMCADLLTDLPKSLMMIEPVGYLDMLMLEKNASVIATDSGGVQKEAFFYQVPCVTLRDETEWVELVNMGWNTLLSPKNSEEIYRTVMRSRNDVQKKDNTQPYGDGRTAEKIIQALGAN